MPHTPEKRRRWRLRLMVFLILCSQLSSSTYIFFSYFSILSFTVSLSSFNDYFQCYFIVSSTCTVLFPFLFVSFFCYCFYYLFTLSFVLLLLLLFIFLLPLLLLNLLLLPFSSRVPLVPFFSSLPSFILSFVYPFTFFPPFWFFCLPFSSSFSLSFFSPLS